MTRLHSVQQQNDHTLAAIRQTAAWWRARPLPEALRMCATSHGIALDTAIVLKLQLAFPGMPAIHGQLLSADGAFIRFEMDIDNDLHALPGTVIWQDISAKFDLAKDISGTCAGYGALCKQVLEEMNGTREQCAACKSPECS